MQKVQKVQKYKNKKTLRHHLLDKQEQKVLKTSATRVNFMCSEQKSKNIYLNSHKILEIVRNSQKMSEIVRNSLY